jgi:hypothetical protein
MAQSAGGLSPITRLFWPREIDPLDRCSLNVRLLSDCLRPPFALESAAPRCRDTSGHLRCCAFDTKRPSGRKSEAQRFRLSYGQL